MQCKRSKSGHLYFESTHSTASELLNSVVVKDGAQLLFSKGGEDVLPVELRYWHLCYVHFIMVAIITLLLSVNQTSLNEAPDWLETEG